MMYIIMIYHIEIMSTFASDALNTFYLLFFVLQ